jgi:HEAT repeat protein
MTMKPLKLTAVAALLCAATSPALAGKGGSAGLIASAIKSGSRDAILAELERTEALMCPECVPLVTNLAQDSRYAVREAAAWWFSKRPGHNKRLTAQMLNDLNGDSIHVRNAADYLGATANHASIPNLAAAFNRGGSTDTRIAIIRAVRVMRDPEGKPILTSAMGDADASVRAAAASAWREIPGQTGAVPVVPLLDDADPKVRAQAATVVGALHETSGVAALEVRVTTDPLPIVRRNAAWALGQLGMARSRAALTTATADTSGLVRNFAKVALAQLH